MVSFPNKPMGYPTKNDHFGVLWGYHHFRKHPYDQSTEQLILAICLPKRHHKKTGGKHHHVKPLEDDG